MSFSKKQETKVQQKNKLNQMVQEKLDNQIYIQSGFSAMRLHDKVGIKELYEDGNNVDPAKSSHKNMLDKFNDVKEKFNDVNDQVKLLQLMTKTLSFRLSYEYAKSDKNDKISKEKAGKIEALENKLIGIVNDNSPDLWKIINEFIDYIDPVLSGLKKSKPKEDFTKLLSKLYDDCLEYRNKYDTRLDISKTLPYILMDKYSKYRKDNESINDFYEDKTNYASARSCYEDVLTVFNKKVKSKYDNPADELAILQLMNRTLQFRSAYEKAKVDKKDKVSKEKADKITALESKLVDLVNTQSPKVKKIIDDFIQYVTLEMLRLKCAKPKESFTLLLSQLKEDCIKISDEHAKLAKTKNVKTPTVLSSSSTMYSKSKANITESENVLSSLEVKHKKNSSR